MQPLAAWSVLLSFFKLLSFARGFAATAGPLVRMIAKIIVDVSATHYYSDHSSCGNRDRHCLGCLGAPFLCHFGVPAGRFCCGF